MINAMICSCKDAEGLTKWEEDFILSVEEQFLVKENLSNRQCEILERIYDKL
jgi:hypothetical protein